ncbi:unnamed protein product [Adineta ricciae]|uniref:G-protein coupled receptors family 1 profile domain-containing protein n=2 Tax=Adineta ricciae TaxID=249248 RepID=A0A815HQP0_ADIRI|nr:unnamed protein product [Adineta ricciae]
MNLESLANELLLDLFDYFNIIELFRSFSGLNIRFNNLLFKHYRSHHIDLRSITKQNFDEICRKYLPEMTDRVISLYLSDDDETPYQLTSFLSYNLKISDFHRLKRLSLIHIRSINIMNDLLRQLKFLPDLKHLEIIDCNFRSSYFHIIWRQCQLTHFKLEKLSSIDFIINNISSSIQNLILHSNLNQFHSVDRLLTSTPHLETSSSRNTDKSFAFNQPKFCSKSVWSQNGMTVADQFTLGSKPSALFIDKKNLIYSINRETMKILVWHQGNIEPTKTIFTGFFNSSSLFVALNGDIYIDNGARSAVKAWILNKKVFIDAMSVFSSCTSLFIDLNDYLYCSMSNHHQIIKKRLHERIMTWTSAAGTGVKGSSSTELDNPYGIFIDSSSNLYVTDCGNDRIQKFRPNVVGGTTEVGRALPARFQYSLSCPTGITLDAQGFLFVVDSKNHRVLRSGISHMRCVLGCDGISIKSTQFLFPSTLAFDSDGNMFVMDSGNHRIRKFQYSPNSCDMSSVIRWTELIKLSKDSQIYSQDCNKESYYFESYEIKVSENRYYTIWSEASIDTYGYIYENVFDPLNPTENLLVKNDDGGLNDQFRFEIPLYDDTLYILVITTFDQMRIGEITLHVSKLENDTIKRLTTSVNIRSIYSSELTVNSPKYCRDYKKPNYYYETLEINVMKNGLYVIWSKSEIDTYGYIYKDIFDPLQPFGNSLTQHSGKCNQHQLKFFIDLEKNTKYILVVTTYYPNTTGNFSVFISGESNATINYFHSKYRSCSVGDRCHFYSTTIGLPLDDILRGEIQPKIALANQSPSIQISSALTVMMFIGGIINSLFSYLTFKNKDTQQVGCGLYLYVSSLTSLLTICMFLINFWFAVFIQINTSTSFAILHVGCIIIEPVLKLLLYCDSWLNASVAIERAVQVLKGAQFNKNKSKRFAQRIIFILPLCIMASLLHEPLHREMSKYETETDRVYLNNTESITKDVFKSEKNKTSIDTIYTSVTNRHVWCVIRYPSSVQTYNIIVLYFHLLIPFVANLFSALYIIIGSARQRSVIQTNQTYKEHVRRQFSEHKQLIISPILLLILSMPRVIISSLPGCIRTSTNLWLYLISYFFSFTPSILIFVIFVIPSDIYMKSFKNSLTVRRARIYK